MVSTKVAEMGDTSVVLMAASSVVQKDEPMAYSKAVNWECCSVFLSAAGMAETTDVMTVE